MTNFAAGGQPAPRIAEFGRGFVNIDLPIFQMLHGNPGGRFDLMFNLSKNLIYFFFRLCLGFRYV